MTTQMAGKQLNSISDKTDWSNPRMQFSFLLFHCGGLGFFSPASFSACSSFLSFTGVQSASFYVFLCLFPSHLSYPFYFCCHTISVPLPTSCMYTHMWPDTQNHFDISFSSLSSLVFPMRQPSQKWDKNSLCLWYVNTTKAVTVTIFSPRETQSFSTDHKGCCFLKFKCSPASSSVS